MISDLRVADVMTQQVRVLRRNDKLSLADDIMRMERVRHLPVLDDESDDLVGILSQRDMFRGALARALGYGERAQQKMLELLAVKEVMTNDVITVSPDTRLPEAARTMLEHRIGCLPVTDAGKMVGILTETDFVKLAGNPDRYGLAGARRPAAPSR